MKRLLILGLLIPLVSWGQGNLIPNFSFEQCLNCPAGGLGQIGVQFAPYNVDVINWFNPNEASPDYFYGSAFPMALLQFPHTDSAYVGLATYDPNGSNIREYVSCSLLVSLQSNSYYWVEFYASVGELFSSVTSNNLGVHFSDTALHSTNMYYFDVDAQLKYFNNEIIDDTLNWVKVCGLYKAQGGESHITLGNFNTDAETTEGVQYNLGNWQTYFLIDDVSVIPLDSIPGGIPVNAGPDQTIYIGDSAFIGQKISNMPDDWFELSGTPMDTNTAGVYVSPSVNTTYVVTRNLNGYYSTDTVTVFVNGVGLEENNPKEIYRIFPIPNNGSFHLKGKVIEYSLVILNAQASVVYEKELNDDLDERMIQTDLSSGTYIVVLKDKSGNEVYKEKIVIMQ